MSYLLQLSIGPVQSFIATARRTRDLWFGSYLLSELSKAVAKSLSSNDEAELIFPSIDKPDTDLEPNSETLIVNNVLSQLRVVNVEDAQKIAKGAALAAHKRWEVLCEQAWSQAEKAASRFHVDQITQLLRKDVWDAQMKDSIEVLWVCAPLAEGDEGYRKANEQVRQLMTMRKNTRAVDQFADNAFALPKSSLDGVRNTVFVNIDANSRDENQNLLQPKFHRFKQALGIEAQEQLDVAGFVKRVVGRERKFLSVSRIAADSWLETLEGLEDQEGKQRAPLHPIRIAMQSVTEKVDDNSIKLNKATTDEYPWLKIFPFDGQLLYPDRLAGAISRAPRLGNDGEALKKELIGLRTALSALPQDLKLRAPCPYYALLLADGDRMGTLIDAATGSKNPTEAHRTISQYLSEFALAVPGEVKNQRGVCVYSGGDDVLAMVRVDKAVACAKALAELFQNKMGEAIKKLNLVGGDGVAVAVPTLSVGIAIMHVLEPLGEVRAMAAKAEQYAKNGPEGTAEGEQRNALCILVKPRSGSENKARIRWDDETNLTRLSQWQAGFDAELPRGLPYELQERFDSIAGVFDSLGDGLVVHGHSEGSLAQLLWNAELKTVLEKKCSPTGEKLDSNIKKELEKGLTDDTANRLELLRIARWLCAKDLELMQ